MLSCFGTLFREKLSTSTNKGRVVTPKIHILECHIPVFARQYGTVGLLGADGVEHLHKIQKVIERRTIFVKDRQRRVEAEQRLEILASQWRSAEGKSHEE